MNFFETVQFSLGPAQYDGAAIVVAVIALMSLSLGAVMTGIAVASTSLYRRLPASVFAVATLAPGAVLAFVIIRDTLAAF